MKPGIVEHFVNYQLHHTKTKSAEIIRNTNPTGARLWLKLKGGSTFKETKIHRNVPPGKLRYLYVPFLMK